MPQRNTPERRDMLAARATGQRKRTVGFTPMLRKPVGHIGRWVPGGAQIPLYRHPVVPASVNPKTLQPHKNDRERLRRLGTWMNRWWNNPNVVITYV